MSNDKNIANNEEQFVVYYHQKTVGHLPKIIASGFQFRNDAEWWAETYKSHHPDCDKLFIAKLPNKNVENILHPNKEQVEEFEAQYTAYAD